MQWLKNRLKNLQVLSIGHKRATGFPDMFADFIKVRAHTIVRIDHPLYPSWGAKTSMTFYKNNKLLQQLYVPRVGKLFFANYVVDIVLSVFLGVFFIPKQIHISLGANNLNTLALIMLKKIGKVKKVIYHTIDYTPHRFPNPLLNWIYHAVDRYCCYRADVLWNSSIRMNEGRVKNGVEENRIAHTIIIPDGSNFDHTKRLPIAKIDRKKVIFLGHLRSGMGLPILIDAFVEVARKIPDARLVIVGGGPLLLELKKMVKSKNLGKHIAFTGFLPRHEDVDNIVRTGAIGVAPFEPLDGSMEYYSDVGKPKVYLAAGMPVIITKVPEIADEIAEKKAGIAIAYSKKQLADAIISLLRNDTIYKLYRRNAIELAKKYNWTNIFTKAFEETFQVFKYE